MSDKTIIEGDWAVCPKTQAMRKDNPEQYSELIKALAELEDCRAKKKELGYWETDVINRIHELMPNYEMKIPGIGKVTRSQSKNKKWDHEAVFNVLTARALDSRKKEVDPETGEITWIEKEAHAVKRVIEECAGISYWKLSSLRDKYGIDPDEYIEVTSSKNAIRIQ